MEEGVGRKKMVRENFPLPSKPDTVPPIPQLPKGDLGHGETDPGTRTAVLREHCPDFA